MTDADKAALRAQVRADRRRAQRSRWALAVSGAGAVTAASLLGLVTNAWLRDARRPAPAAQVVTKRQLIITTRYVRPKPRIKIVRVVHHVPAAASTSYASTSYSPPSASYAPAPAPAAAPAPQVQVQVSQPAPAPPTVSTHAS